jgi:hypothetical protein
MAFIISFLFIFPCVTTLPVDKSVSTSCTPLHFRMDFSTFALQWLHFIPFTMNSHLSVHGVSFLYVCLQLQRLEGLCFKMNALHNRIKRIMEHAMLKYEIPLPWQSWMLVSGAVNHSRGNK